MITNHDWILAVLDDINIYAKKNNLPIIAEEIERQRQIVEWEIDAKHDTKFPALSVTIGNAVIS